MKRGMRAIGLAALGWLPGCGAPASQPATGPVAEAVERALASGTGTFDHSVWDALLREGTRDGFVDYTYMAEHADELSAYLGSLARADLAALAPAELEALLLNAYNALTVRVILDHPTVTSIRDIEGVWTDLTWEVGGHRLTLDNIEHNLLRPFFRDPRIHFAVNCASVSCAPLPPWAFTGPGLEDQLEERTRAFLRDPEHVRVEDGRLYVSRYFDWYGEDFTAEGWEPRAPTIPAFIAGYATPDVRAAIERTPDIRLVFNDYDWSLNAVTRPDGARASDGATGGAGSASRGSGGETEAVAAEGEEDAGGLAGLVLRFRGWVERLGPVAPLAYGAGYVLFVVLLVPGSTLTLGAGITFGLLLGTVVVVVAANIGAFLAFLIARYLLRERVERWLEGRERLSAIDRAVEKQGWRVVALTRLSPAFPFNVQNYFYGLTGVSPGGYALATLFGMLPGTLLYVYIGAAGAEVAAATGGATTWGETALLIAGLAATVAVVALVTRVARRELERATAGTDAEPGLRDRAGASA